MHLTNTFLANAVQEEKKTLKSLYEKVEEATPFFLREPSDVNGFMVSLSKGVSTGQDTYGKGFGEDFRSFNAKEEYDGLVLAMDRWDHGERMDFSTRGGKIVYWMRTRLVYWLRMCLFTEPNILRDSMFIFLTDTTNVTSTFIRAVIQCKFVERWKPLLCAKEVSCADAPAVLQATYRACFISPLSYETTFFSADFDVFSEFNTSGSRYRQWLEDHKNKTGRTFDGKIIKINEVIEREIYDPQEITNRSEAVREHRCLLLQSWLKGISKAIENGEGARYLEGGDMASMTDEHKGAFKGTWSTTNILEGAIGDLKHVGRRTDNLPVAAASNLAVAQRNNMFGSPDEKYLQKKCTDRATPRTTEKKRQKLSDGRST